MAKLINEIVRVEYKPNMSFGQRKKTLNENIQKQIDFYNSRGYVTVSHKLNTDTATHASVQFTLQKIVR